MLNYHKKLISAIFIHDEIIDTITVNDFAKGAQLTLENNKKQNSKKRYTRCI